MGININYGVGSIDLEKSQEYIGVKVKSGFGQFITRMFSAFDLEPVGRMMGGFQLMGAKFATDLDSILDRIRKQQGIQSGTHVYEGMKGMPIVPSDQLYIIFREGIPVRECQAVIAKYHLNILVLRSQRSLVARVTPLSPNPVKTAALMQQEPCVEVCEPNFSYSIMKYGLTMPNDNLFSRQWYLKNTGNDPVTGSTFGLKRGADAKVVEAWELLGNYGSSNITIAVIDDGFDLNHPDFQGKIVSPFDFETNTAEPKNLLRRLEDSHGTNCAGVALAKINGQGIVGAAPNAKFMPIRIYGVDDDTLERMFKYMVDKNADIVSCSWGIPFKELSTRAINAIKYCAERGRQGRGSVVLFAAGNEGDRIWGFAKHPNVICVGASSSIDTFSDYSNKGAQVSITAPSNGSGGLGVVTTDAGIFTDEFGNQVDGGKYAGTLYRDDFGGTSSATPLAAGCVALLLSANPNLTAAQVKRILETTADKIGSSTEYDTNGHSDKFGYGRINIARAIQRAKGTTTTNEVVREMAAIPLRARASGSLKMANDFQYFAVSIGNQLLVQLRPTGGVADLDLYIRKGQVPNISTKEYDAFSAQTPSSSEAITLNAVTAGDYYIAVRSKQGAASYNLIVGLSGTNRKINPELAQKVGGITQMRLSGNIAAKIDATGQTQVFRVTIPQRFTITLDGPNDTSDFDMYVRKDNLPIPQSRQYDFTSSELATSDEKVAVEGNTLYGEHFILVKSSKGVGNFDLIAAL